MSVPGGLAYRVADEAPAALVASRLDGRVTYWNAAAQSMFGYARDEAVGRSISELVMVQLDGTASVMSLDRTAPVEAVRRCKDGSLIYVQVSTREIVDADGQIEGHLQSIVDVTFMKVQRDARLVERRYRDLLDSMPDAIVMVEGIGRILFVNRQAEALFGYGPGELLGRPLELLMPERFRRAHVGHRLAYLAQSRTRPMGVGLELYGLRRNGEEFPVEISLSPLDTDVGRLGMSAIRDISERRVAEQVLREKNIELQAASQAKDRFLATMSHELRTPLNAVIGFTGLLLMKLPGPLTADQEKQLLMIQTSAKHLLSLINDLLDVAKIDSGGVRLESLPVGCRGLIEEVVATLCHTAEAKGLELRFERPADDVVVQTDRRAAQQVLINLVNNAIKFTDAGSVVVGLTVDRRGDAPVARLTVRDTGRGISQADAQRLFQPFSQVGELPSRSEGTGLGLYLSRKFAEMLGGRIELDSEPGRGSRFTLVLPLEPAP